MDSQWVAIVDSKIFSNDKKLIKLREDVKYLKIRIGQKQQDFKVWNKLTLYYDELIKLTFELEQLMEPDPDDIDETNVIDKEFNKEVLKSWSLRKRITRVIYQVNDLKERGKFVPNLKLHINDLKKAIELMTDFNFKYFSFIKNKIDIV